MKKNDEERQPFIQVGDIVGTHGLRGDVKVRPRSGDPDILLTAKQVVLRSATGSAIVAEVCRQAPHKGVVLMRFGDYDSISAAEPLVGYRVEMPQSDLPELAEDEYYWGELEGLNVLDRRYGNLGCVTGIFTTAAHDTYVVTGNYGEVLIPAVKQFIVSVDLEGKIMTVDLPLGLVTEPE